MQVIRITCESGNEMTSGLGVHRFSFGDILDRVLHSVAFVAVFAFSTAWNWMILGGARLFAAIVFVLIMVRTEDEPLTYQ